MRTVPQGSLTDASSTRVCRHGSGFGAIAAAMVAVAGLALVAWRLDWERLATLGSVHAWALLAAAACLQLATLPLKALGWQVALRAVHPSAAIRLRTVLSPVAVGALFNLVLAGRVGDAARVLLMHARLRRADVPAPLSTIVGSAITETLVSTVAWVALVALAGTLVPLPSAAWLVVAGVALAAALVGLAALRGWGRRQADGGPGVGARLAAACRRVWTAVADGHRTLRRPRVLVPLGGVSVAGWAAQWASVLAVLAAFDVPDTARAATLVLVSISVAQTLPVLPGNLGVFQAAAALPLVTSSGVAPTVAVAIGVVLQLVQTAPVAVTGAAATTRQGEDLRDLWSAARGFELRAAWRKR
jgi:uncharacterized membrane protein YbhN (UPF0104 family)